MRYQDSARRRVRGGRRELVVVAGVGWGGHCALRTQGFGGVGFWLWNWSGGGSGAAGGGAYLFVSRASRRTRWTAGWQGDFPGWPLSLLDFSHQKGRGQMFRLEHKSINHPINTIIVRWKW
jgi:hypothetical protein